MSQSSFLFLQKIWHPRNNQNRVPVNARSSMAVRTPTIKKPSSPLWFDMQLYLNNQIVNSIDTWGTYILTIKTCTEPTSLQNQFCRIHSEDLATLQLNAQCIASTYPIFDHRIYFDEKDDIYNFQRTFTMEIPANLQTETLMLQLRTITPMQELIGSYTLPVTYTKQTINIPQETTRTNQLKPNVPPEVVILNINAHPHLDHTLAFTISGQNSAESLQKQTYQSELIANLPQLMHIKDGDKTKYQDAIEIRGHMRTFSIEFRPLIEKWLKKLQKIYQDKLTLVIIDTSNMEIPWEMIEIAPYEYIGTIATVTRWQPQMQAKNMSFNLFPHNHQGAVLYYLDKQLGRYLEQERQVMQMLQTKHCSSLEILESYLYRPLDNFGLIYIGCHGAQGRSLQEQYPDKLTANRLSVIDPHEETRPIAFINACESARIIRNEAYATGNFVSVMLKNLVGGYIGTLAKVGQKEASIIARDFIELGKAEPLLTISETLRNLRRAAAQKLYQMKALSPMHAEKKECEYMFFYTFLYVYYGNPLARLQLTLESASNNIDAQSTQTTVEEQPCNN